MFLEKGHLLHNRYEILERIGMGGMAVVYKAVDTKLSRKVAIKVLRSEYEGDEEFIQRFENEAQAAAQLAHPNIVNVYDVEESDGIYYIVMELVDGKTLKDLIDEKSPFDEKSVLSVAHQIANALLIAHSHGIVHRDIKPQNILVTRDGTVKVADFGIARATTSKTIASKAGAIGSVHYFSPEQAKGGYVDGKSDIYSLGIVMFEMLTGRLPFDGESSVEVALKHINDELPSLSEADSNLSESVKAIVEKATQKRKELRYASIDIMMQDLKKALTDKSGYFVVKKKIDTSQTIKFSDEEFMQLQAGGKQEEERSEDAEETENPVSDGEDVPEEKNDLILYDENFKPKKPEKKPMSNDMKVVVAAVVTAIIIIIGIILAISKYLFGGQNPITQLSTVPDFVGMTYENAQTQAELIGIELAKNEINSGEVEKDKIISQGKEAGTEFVKGDIIEVTVSLGARMYDLPDVEMTDMNEALDMLGKIPGVEIEEPEWQYDETIAYGIVIKQEPQGDQQVSEGTAVKLYISKGPEKKMVTMPDVVGMKEADAIVALEELDLVVSTKNASNRNHEKGMVISQSVDSGEKVTVKSIIEIVISTGAPPEPEQETAWEDTSTEDDQTQTQAQTETNDLTIPPEDPDTDAQRKRKRTITYEITPGTLAEGTQSVDVKMIVTPHEAEDGTSFEPYNQTVGVTDFPIEVSVTSSGVCDVSLYFNGELEWQDVVDFDD